MILRTCVCLLALFAAAGRAGAQPPGTPAAPANVPTPSDVKPGSINHEDVPYPHPVSYLSFTIYGQDVRMAYMDVPPAAQPNGRTVVLLHGMNFAGFYWAGPIEVLRKEGFRVVVTDQIGFGRSSKPIVPYNFHDMALNTKRVLDHLGIAKAAIVGDSMVYTDPVVYDWAHITSKALVIGGEKDGPDFPKLARHVADTIPGAQLVLVPNAGHVLHFETPEIFNRELVKFLKADAPTRSQAGK